LKNWTVILSFLLIAWGGTNYANEGGLSRIAKKGSHSLKYKLYKVGVSKQKYALEDISGVPPYRLRSRRSKKSTYMLAFGTITELYHVYILPNQRVPQGIYSDASAGIKIEVKTLFKKFPLYSVKIYSSNGKIAMKSTDYMSVLFRNRFRQNQGVYIPLKGAQRNNIQGIDAQSKLNFIDSFQLDTFTKMVKGPDSDTVVLEVLEVY